MTVNLKNDYNTIASKKILEALIKYSDEKNMADILREGLDKYLVYRNETNQVFLKIQKNILNKLNEHILFEVWEDLGEEAIIRFVTSYATTKEEIDEALKSFKSIVE